MRQIDTHTHTRTIFFLIQLCKYISIHTSQYRQQMTFIIIFFFFFFFLSLLLCLWLLFIIIIINGFQFLISKKVMRVRMGARFLTNAATMPFAYTHYNIQMSVYIYSDDDNEYGG